MLGGHGLPVGGEGAEGLECLPRPVEPGLHGVLGDAERLGRLRRVELLDASRQPDRPVALRKAVNQLADAGAGLLAFQLSVDFGPGGERRRPVTELVEDRQ